MLISPFSLLQFLMIFQRKLAEYSDHIFREKPYAL